MEDQRIRNHGFRISSLIFKITVAMILLALANHSTGRKLGFAHVLKSTIATLRPCVHRD